MESIFAKSETLLTFCIELLDSASMNAKSKSTKTHKKTACFLYKQ